MIGPAHGSGREQPMATTTKKRTKKTSAPKKTAKKAKKKTSKNAKKKTTKTASKKTGQKKSAKAKSRSSKKTASKKVSASGRRQKVVIVGAGAAGVFTAYRLEEMYGNAYDIELLEESGRIGGNAYARRLEYGDKKYSIDCGAQFFYRNAQPSYVSLIADLGLFDEPAKIQSKATGITIWDADKDERLLWLPSHMGRFTRYKPQDWRELSKFGRFILEAFDLDRNHPNNWNLSLDDWLAGLDVVGNKFKDRVLRPFLYQFVTMPQSRIGEASALYAVTYFVRSLFGEAGVDEPDPDVKDPRGLETFEVYQSKIGLEGIMDAALDAAGVRPALNEQVQAVVKQPNGKLKVRTRHRTIMADHVVMATDPNTSAFILGDGGFDPKLVENLASLEYDRLNIAMQKDGTCWMPGNDKYWEAVNTMVKGDDYTFTAWFGPLRDNYRIGKKGRIPVFKSWASPDLDPRKCQHTFFAHEHNILLPTVDFMKTRKKVLACQGNDNVWFVGGWTNWFDSQEAALDSATDVADRFDGVAGDMTGKETMEKFDSDAHRRRIERWLKRVARRAPKKDRDELIALADQVKKID